MLSAIITMLIIGALLGLMLGVAAKVFYVKEDERATKVSSMLPGYNCGGCGYPGCSGLANALVNGELNQVTCKPCKDDRRKEITEYLNTTPGPNGETLNIIYKD